MQLRIDRLVLLAHAASAHGIDVDGDGAVDVAFTHVCIEYPRGDSICGEHAVVAARWEAGGWNVTSDCAGDGCPGMLAP